MKTTISSAFAIALLAGMATSGQAADPPAAGASPALCGAGDSKEPGLQGDVPAGLTAWKYNCGVKLIAELPLRGNVQGVGSKCAYVRSSAGATLDTDQDGKITLKEWTDGKRDPAEFAASDTYKDGVLNAEEQGAQRIHVIDMSNPAKPKVVRSVPVEYKSETMRVVTTKERSILVSGSSVYDLKDCLNPVLMGEIKWPPLAIGTNPPAGGGGGSGMLPHDLRVNHAGTKVYGTFGLWEVDITNLKDPPTWKVTDHRCAINAQVPGPWQAIHEWANKSGRSLCDDQAGAANNRVASSGYQTNLIWPQMSHSLDVSGDDKIAFIADQAPGGGTIWQPTTMMRIVDVSQKPAKFLGEVNGPGHSVDWFRAGGRDYVLHANEQGSGGGAGPAAAGTAAAGRGGAAPAAGRGGAAAAGRGGAAAAGRGGAPAAGRGGAAAPGGAATAAAPARAGSDPCRAYPRPTALGWAFEALITDVTNPAQAKNVSMLQIGINDPARCDARKASGRDPTVAYHLIDDPMNAHFAAVNFGSAGLRIFDIRQPEKASEVAYFNYGSPVHGGIGHYDAARKLIYVAGNSGFYVLEIEPQVRKQLGL